MFSAQKYFTGKISGLKVLVLLFCLLLVLLGIHWEINTYSPISLFQTVYYRPFSPFYPAAEDDKNTYQRQMGNSFKFKAPIGNEEAQMNVFWRKLFKGRNVQSAMDVIWDYQQEYLGSGAMEFMHRSPKWLVPSISDYKHMLTQTYSQTHLCVQITEFLRGVRTVGGSNFILAVRGSYSIDVSRSLDYFNGTYQVCTRYFESEIHVILTLYYYHFGAFRLERTGTDTTLQLICEKVILSIGKSVRVISRKHLDTIKKENLPFKHYYSRLSTNAFNLSTKTNTKLNSLEEYYAPGSVVFDILAKGAWVIYKGHWRLLYSNAIVARSPKRRTQHCLMEYSSVTFVGDSHLRYMFYYLVSFVTKPDTTWGRKLQFYLRTERFSFWWKAKGVPFNMYLKNLRRSLIRDSWEGFSYPKRKRGHLIVMSIGQHDIELSTFLDKRVGPGLYLENMYNSLLILKDIVGLARLKNLSLVWVAHPPFPGNYSFQANFRNNIILAALNQWLLPKIHMLGIPILNVYDKTFVLSDLDPCFGHYLCVTPGTGEAVGDAGIAMADLLLSLICSPRPAVINSTSS